MTSADYIESMGDDSLTIGEASSILRDHGHTTFTNHGMLFAIERYSDGNDEIRRILPDMNRKQLFDWLGY